MVLVDGSRFCVRTLSKARGGGRGPSGRTSSRCRSCGRRSERRWPRCSPRSGWRSSRRRHWGDRGSRSLTFRVSLLSIHLSLSLSLCLSLSLYIFIYAHVCMYVYIYIYILLLFCLFASLSSALTPRENLTDPSSTSFPRRRDSTRLYLDVSINTMCANTVLAPWSNALPLTAP